MAYFMNTILFPYQSAGIAGICRKSSPYNCVCSLSMSDSKDKYKILSSTKYYGTFLNGKKNLLECEIDA